MSEETLIVYVRNGLRKWAHVTKHNDGCTTGMSDLSIHFIGARGSVWMELKATHSWPTRPDTRVRWDHYTEEQAVWIRQRKGWLLARVGRSYLLFDALAALELWQANGWTKQQMFAGATLVWANCINWRQLAEVIRAP